MSRLLDLLYPKRCVLCSRILPWGKQEQHCSFCLVEKEKLKGRRCRICSRPVSSDDSICRSCLVHQILTPGYSLLPYEGKVRDSIHQFKYGGQKGYAVEYADWIYRFAPEVLKTADILIPIPIHRRRRMERGYNQAEELAKALSQKSGIPYKNLLMRTRNTAPQNALTAYGRRKNVKDAFVMNKKATLDMNASDLNRLPEQDIKMPFQGDLVLVDDIYTSGSTIEEAAAVLRAACPDRTVRFLTLAMKMEKAIV